MSFQDFSLIPPDDPPVTPDDDLTAASDTALALPDSVTPVDEDPEMPFGMTWKFDWEVGQFVPQGQSPLEVSGLDAVAEWCQMAIHTARYAHPIFSDAFGMEDPDSVIGEIAVGEAVADWQRHLVDALLVHERITSIENMSLEWDPTDGTLYILSLDVVTDEDQRFTISDVTLQTGGQ